jgi:hypothetical protein
MIYRRVHVDYDRIYAVYVLMLSSDNVGKTISLTLAGIIDDRIKAIEDKRDKHNVHRRLVRIQSN